jgi:ribonuclease-3 family protein
MPSSVCTISFTSHHVAHQSVFVNNNSNNNYHNKRFIRLTKGLKTSLQDDESSTSETSTQHTKKDDNSKFNEIIVQQQLSLLTLLQPSTDCRVEQMSTTDLAYIGDVVYELFIRCRTVWPSKKTSILQNDVVTIVRAENQAVLLNKLRNANDSIQLTNTELQILSRGRNAQNTRKQHRNPAAYQDSTAFEALIGYLYITNTTRCAEILQWIDKYGLES